MSPSSASSSTWLTRAPRTHAPLTPEEMADDKQVAVWQKAGLLRLIDGKNWLYDGRTGRRFDNPVTVGYVVLPEAAPPGRRQDPRPGHRPLLPGHPAAPWAARPSSAASASARWRCGPWRPTAPPYTLQEILTVKSDDVTGRVKTYEAIVKGLNVPKPGVPESFKVLIKELQSLCLDVRVLDEAGNEIELKDDEEDDYKPVGRLLRPGGRVRL